jgi:zinc protease
MRRLLSLTFHLMFAALLLPAVASAQGPRPLQPVAEVEGIREYRLPNGLQVLLVADDSKPTTTVNLTYRVGSRHENYGETGMAHLLEHLIFKGSKRHPLAWAEFNKRGLRANGTTWFDRTNYFASFSSNDANLEWTLDWLADSMTNSFIARKDLDTEMTVVRNEWEMGENSPEGVLLEKAMASHYQWHNYGKTTIGARSDVENVDIGRLQAFYRLYYQPDNATLIVTGRFDPARTLAWVQKYFGPIPKPRRSLPKLYTLEPTQDGERQVTLRRTGGTPQLMALYHTSPGAHPDHVAVELLASIMGDAPAGRLHKRLTEANLAASTFGWAPALHDPGFVTFGASLAPGHDTAAATAALLATLESVKQQPITAEELERARVQYLKAWELQFANPERVGVALSEFVALGDWRLFFLLRDRVAAVTLADVQRVAEQRLLPANRTLGTYLPTDAPVRAPAPAFVDVAAQLKAFKPRPSEPAVPPFDTTPANLDRRTERGRLPAPAAGVQVALLPKPTRGQAVRATLVLRGGNLEAFRGQAEVASMMAALLDKGSTTLTRQQVSDRLDTLRAQVAFGYGVNEPGALTVRMETRREHLPALIELVGELLRRPAFDAAVLDEMKRLALAGIEAERKEPDAVLDEALFRLQSPYPRGDVRHVRSFDERIADIQAVTPAALAALHRQVVGASRAELAVVGDFDAAALKAAAVKALGDWPTAVPYERVRYGNRTLTPQRLEFRTPDKQNASLRVVMPLALNESSPDYAPLLMGTYLLGNGGNSRLWTRIREREGLSYNVYASIGWDLYDTHSWFVGGAIYAPGNRAKVEAAFREEVERVRREGFTARELEEGKRGLISFRALSRAQDGNVATNWARNLDLNRSFARAAEVDAQLQALTLEQVQAAFNRHIDPARFVWGVAGDFK